MNNVVMLAIACTKALLVILFFMHVRWSTRLTWVVAASGFFWLLILFGITMADYLTPRLGRWDAALTRRLDGLRLEAQGSVSLPSLRAVMPSSTCPEPASHSPPAPRHSPLYADRPSRVST